MALRTARWTCTPYYVAAAERIAAELGVSRQLATILARRGCSDPESARRLLDATERHDPLDFARIGAACDAILGHVRAGSRIVVHGDYDVDGVCSTAILVEALRWLGAEPAWHVPDREDGYGLSVATVERLVAAGTRLIVTADCAVAAVDEVARARELGVDVVVTDHHRPAERLPDCPIVHPAVCGYPFPHLCAAAVAQKLAEALLARAGADPARAAEHADLVALATVADVVKLQGENRRLVREGLKRLGATAKPGLRALMRVARVDKHLFLLLIPCIHLVPGEGDVAPERREVGRYGHDQVRAEPDERGQPVVAERAQMIGQSLHLTLKGSARTGDR